MQLALFVNDLMCASIVLHSRTNAKWGAGWRDHVRYILAPTVASVGDAREPSESVLQLAGRTTGAVGRGFDPHVLGEAGGE